MPWDFANVKDVAQFISNLVTSLSLIGLWVAYAFSRKQMHFSTMTKCINDFREIEKEKLNRSDDIIAKNYIDLVNEEFFYVENSYLPLEVSIEWVDGMIDYLPFISIEGEFRKSESFKIFDNLNTTNKLLMNYPRVFKAIKLRCEINFESIHSNITIEDEGAQKLRKLERDKLIFQMISNLNIGRLTRLTLKRTISQR